MLQQIPRCINYLKGSIYRYKIISSSWNLKKSRSIDIVNLSITKFIYFCSKFINHL
jgi:hypothetical protein